MKSRPIWTPPWLNYDRNIKGIVQNETPSGIQIFSNIDTGPWNPGPYGHPEAQISAIFSMSERFYRFRQIASNSIRSRRDFRNRALWVPIWAWISLGSLRRPKLWKNGLIFHIFRDVFCLFCSSSSSFALAEHASGCAQYERTSGRFRVRRKEVFFRKYTLFIDFRYFQ